MLCTEGPPRLGRACQGACPGAPPELSCLFWCSGRPGRGPPLLPCSWHDAPPGGASWQAPSH
eukprot:10729293-Ditylum_brightwellii.AAC.1